MYLNGVLGGKNGKKREGSIQGGEIEFYKLMKDMTTQDHSGSSEKKY